jgi:hypothetical protein
MKKYKLTISEEMIIDYFKSIGEEINNKDFIVTKAETDDEYNEVNITIVVEEYTK